MSTKFHQKQWFTWLLLIFIAPVGIFFLWKNKHYGKTVNIILSIVFVLFFISVVGSKDQNTNTKISVTSPKTTISKTVIATIQPTIKPTPTLTKEEIIKLEEAKQKAEAEAKEKKAKEDYDRWVKDQFSLWDGSHKELVKLLKKNLNDADSFEHVETTYKDNKDSLTIKMTYRAKNAFGAKILQNVTAKADYKNNTIAVISQNN